MLKEITIKANSKDVKQLAPMVKQLWPEHLLENSEKILIMINQQFIEA